MVPLHLFDAADGDSFTSALNLGHELLHHLLPAERVDDRFRDTPDRVGVYTDPAREAGPDGVIAISAAPRRDGSSLPPWSMQMALRPGTEDHLCPLVSGSLPAGGAELWVRPENLAIVNEIGRCWPTAFNCRRLHLMTIDLPVAIEPIATRALNPDDENDLEAVVRVNNAAFHSHPDQAGMSVESVRSKLAGVGHSAQGVRLAEIDGEIKGFCWTQIHHQRMLGEISVIGLHPDVHGRGLGAPMTAAGLQWLYRQGLTTTILYVEAENTAAVRSYHRLGFETAHDDVSWIIPGAATEEPNV